MSTPFKTKIILLLVSTSLFFSACTPNSSESEYQLTYEMPVELSPLPANLNDAQAYLEEQTWQNFVAINWPAMGTSTAPDTEKGIPSDNSYQTVWNNYGLNYDLYLLPEGETPLPLEDVAGRRAQRKKRWMDQCSNVLENGDDPTSYLILDEFIEASLDPAPHHPLIDQNGAYVRTTVLYNKKLYDFVEDNKLYELSGVQDYLWSDAVAPFKTSTENDTTFASYRIAAPDESIMLKASWKVLGEGDDPEKFFTKNVVFVFENMNLGDGTTPSNKGTIPTSCEIIKVGLVGLHFTIKTPGQPSWVWSTFEHIDNVPNLADEELDGHYNFFEKASLSDSPLINNPSNPTDKNAKYTGNPYWYNPSTADQKPNQVMREIPIAPQTQKLNKYYQGLLANTVWKNYQLVGTQWEYKVNQLSPRLLSNSTLESYEQSQASCMGCHNLVGGKINNPFQQALGNNPNISAPLTMGFKTINNKVEQRSLHSDYMWSNLKIYPTGQLSWTQVRSGN